MSFLLFLGGGLYSALVVVCPVDCFYQDEAMLYIDPVDCLDCDACMPECPVEAIFPDTEVPAKWAQFIAINAERSAALKLSGGNIRKKQDAKEGPGCKK